MRAAISFFDFMPAKYPLPAQCLCKEVICLNILIVGCGRVGSHLVRTLEDLGHDVSVLEGDEKNVDRLLSMENHEFGGMVQVGSPIDEDMLRQAGIENCDAVAAVCPEDNINLMVCQIASEIFHVPRVLARVADPVRKKIFAERFGMHIICSTNLTVEAILRGVLTGSEGRHLSMGSSSIDFTATEPDPSLLGQPLSRAAIPEGQGILGILRANGSVELNTVPSPLIHAGDRIIYSSMAD